jgi:hypothetical protein
MSSAVSSTSSTESIPSLGWQPQWKDWKPRVQGAANKIAGNVTVLKTALRDYIGSLEELPDVSPVDEDVGGLDSSVGRFILKQRHAAREKLARDRGNKYK